ncbi:immunoglobulin superfamily member 10 [Arapaima gigas]
MTCRRGSMTLTLLCIFAHSALLSCACPVSCVCSLPSEVHCTFRYLSAVPGRLDPAVKRINLGYNSLTLLKEDDFAGLSRLELLMLHSNAIHQVEDGAFRELRVLQVLKMSYNRVREIKKDTFFGLKSLVRLHVDHNRIEFIHPEAFRGLTALQLVHLEGNLLQQLHPDTFVTMSYSQIFKTSSIRSINLSDNTVSSLPACIFSHCARLESVYLHGNPWSCDCRLDWLVNWARKDTGRQKHLENFVVRLRRAQHVLKFKLIVITLPLPGVLKCKRDKKYMRRGLCPICESPAASKGQNIVHLPLDTLSCSKPRILPHLKEKNFTVEEGDRSPISPADFIAPIGSLAMNVTDQFHNNASLACAVQRPLLVENLTVSHSEGATALSAHVITSLICNIDYEQIQQLWHVLAMYSDTPMRLERGLMLAKTPEMIYRYTQKNPEGEVFTGIEAEFKATPGWLMQDEVSLQLDRSTTTFNALHIKYSSTVQLREDSKVQRNDRYGWTMIKRDNQTMTERSVLLGGLVDLKCVAHGHPEPSIEWILPDGSKVRSPYASEDGRIIITATGGLTVRAADTSDTGLYRCVATNYLDADVLTFWVTVLPLDVEEEDVNGVRLSYSLGDDLLLDCDAAGNPKPSVQWILPDLMVLDKSHGNRRLHQNGSLTVQGLTKQDRGVYRCLAANHMGADLLASQVMVSGSEEKFLEAEGSGDESDPNLEGNVETDPTELPSSQSSSSQEPRTVPADHPFPKQQPSEKPVSSYIAPRWSSSASRRRPWGLSRTFNKPSRKADPKRQDEILTKTRKGGETAKEKVGYVRTVTSGLTRDEFAGSGDSFSEGKLITDVVVTSGRSDETRRTLSQTDATPSLTAASVVAPGTLGINSNPITLFRVSHQSTVSPDVLKTYTLESKTQRRQNLPFTLQAEVSDATREMQVMFSGDSEDTATGVMTLLRSRYPHRSSTLDGLVPRAEPVVLTSTDSSGHTTFTAVTTTEQVTNEIMFQTTQKIKSPGLPAGSTIISHQQIHIIPPAKQRPGRRRNFPGRRRIIRPNRITDISAYLDKFKKSTFKERPDAQAPPLYRTDRPVTTALSTLERRSTTFPTPPNANSPHTTAKFSALQASTTQPPSTTTSNNIITSGDFPELYVTQDPWEVEKSSSQDRVTPSTKATTPSKVIRGKIPWQKFFGTKDQKEFTNRFRKPSAKPATTSEPTTAAPTSPTTALGGTVVLPTAQSLVPPATILSTSTDKNTMTQSTEISSDDFSASSPISEIEVESRFGKLSIATRKFVIPTPTTFPSFPSPAHSTTAKASASTQTLAFPPAIHPDEKTPEASSRSSVLVSGSGWYNKDVVHKRGGSRRPKWGRRTKAFKRRRPGKSSTTTILCATVRTTTESSSTPAVQVSTMKTVPSAVTALLSQPQQTLSRQAKPIQSIRTTTAHPSRRETSTYSEEDAWKVPPSAAITSPSKVYPATARPRTTLHKSNPTPRTLRTQTQSTSTTSRSHPITSTFRIGNSVRALPGKEFQNPTEGTPIKKVRPTSAPQRSTAAGMRNEGNVEVSGPEPVKPTQRGGGYGARDWGESFTLDFLTTVREERGHTNTPSPYNPPASHSGSKPRIMGGNEARYTVLSNSDAYLPCEAVGSPEPSITWKRFNSVSGSALAVPGRMGKFQVFSNGTLFIQSANLKDRGRYLCLAENSFGSDKLLVTLSVVAYPSRILEPKLRDLNSRAGRTVEMKCKAEGRPPPLISWVLANRTQIRDYDLGHKRVTVTPDGTLVIRQVSVYDRGHYKCIASNPAGVDSVTVRLQVVAAPPGILEEKRQNVIGQLGQSLSLSCSAQGNPQPIVHWVLSDGTVIRPLQDIRPDVSLSPNGTLRLRDLSESHGGKYECIATSSTGSERRVVMLSVQRTDSVPHIVEVSQHWMELGYGHRLLLNCSAVGQPKPAILWRLPSKAIVDQGNRTGGWIHVLDNGTLIIDSLGEKDAGDYLCIARNKMGDDLQLMKVFVSMKPAKIETKLLDKKWVPYGDDLNVDCQASGVPAPDISWSLPDGTLLSGGSQADDTKGRTRRYILFENGTLYVNEVGMVEEGDYTCYAENTLGKDEMLVHVTVVPAAPRIKEPGSNYMKVKIGGSVRFDCEAVGKPKPRVLWTLPSHDVIAASSERHLVHVNGSLDIRRIEPADAGEYVCTARNAAGDDRKVYGLDVDGNPPVINGYGTNRTVVKDTAVKYSRKLIDCKAEGNPPPQVTWIMPDNVFLTAPYFGSRINVHQNGTLEIRNVRPTDTAEFICMARNDGGEVVMVVQLEVVSMLRRPIFRNPFNERVVTPLGKTTVLNCSADGRPMPEISWLFPNGTRVTGSSHGIRYQLGNDGTLRLYNPGKEDAGKYRCAAKNSVGYIEKLIVLEVGRKPYILTRPKGVIRSISGEPLYLHCLADGSPRPHIRWTLPGGRVLSGPQTSGRYLLLENGTLIVRDSTFHDRGNYLCGAKNEAGEDLLAVPVIVVAYPPRITMGPPRSFRGPAGQPVQLSCAAVGLPRPEIVWQLPDHTVLSPTTAGQATGNKQILLPGTLIIQRPTVSDSGPYRCTAKNPMGADSRVTYIHVL